MRRFVSFIRAQRLEIVSFAVGFVVLAFELTAARLVAPYLGDTIYSWTSIIGIILAALAFGYTRGGKLADRRHSRTDVILLICLAAFTISLVGLTKDFVLHTIAEISLPLQIQALLASLFLFAVPTVLLGMSAPYITRLSITDVTSSGRKLSRIDAASTIGSLAGTFSTGYFLFGWIGSNHLLTVLAICLVAASFLMALSYYWLFRLTLVGFLLATSLAYQQLNIAGVVAEIDTAYSRVLVRDITYAGRPIRVLQIGDDSSLQSGKYLDGDPSPVFAYTRGFAYAAELKPQAQRNLIIGGGAFTFSTYLAARQPQTTIDTVEIDSQLESISKQYFGFAKPQNINIITADGRQYLNTTSQQYDTIFLDAFNSSTPPFQLFTVEAVKAMKAALATDGIVVSNVIAAPTGNKSILLRDIYDTFRDQFPYVSVYRVNPSMQPLDNRQNLLLIASRQPLSRQTLSAVAQNNPEFAAMQASALQLDRANKTLLTDDFAPVEQLAQRQ